MSDSEHHQQHCEGASDPEMLFSDVIEKALKATEENARRMAYMRLATRHERREVQSAEDIQQSELTGRILAIKAEISALPHHDDPTKRVAWPAE